MDDITIIGAGVAGRTLIEKIRERNNDCRIVFIDKKAYSFQKFDLISHPVDIARRTELKEWAERFNCEFLEATVDRINLRRRKIYFKESEPKDFDKLIIATGLKSKKKLIKGEHREGFFYLSQLDPFLLRDFLKISNEAVIEISTWLGVRLSLALRTLGKEVRIVSADLDFLGGYKGRILSLFEEKSIQVSLNAQIDEAVGEGRIKATKISPLKVFSSQLVFIDNGFSPALDFFEEEVLVHDTFFTDYEGIYLLGDSNRKGVEEESFFCFYEKEAQRQALIFSELITEGKGALYEKKDWLLEEQHAAIEELLKANENPKVEGV